MSEHKAKRMLGIVVVVVLVGLGVWYAASGRLMHDLLALHGRH